MRIIIVVYVVMIFSSMVSAQQTLPDILQTIELNNTSLKSLRAQADAIIIGNKTGLNPSNPEVEYIYQWGNTDQLGNKQEFHIRQSFDFPTAYRYRKQMMQSLNNQAEREYLNAYNRVMLDAQERCYQLIYQNALLKEYEIRLGHAEMIAEAYRLKFEVGDANILERNKADINLLNARNGLLQVKSERDYTLEQLIGINGGMPLIFDLNEWPIVELPSDFDDWFLANADIIPELQSLQQNLNAQRYNEKLNKAMTLPKITGGYSAEAGAVDKFKGVNLGLTIPLWENKNTVKHEKLKTIATENKLADIRLQLYHGLKGIYLKGLNTKRVSEDYKASLILLSNADYLQRALNSGEISILEYMLELSMYYETIKNAYDAQLNYRLNVAQLNAFQIN